MRKVIAANWKMNMSLKEIDEYFSFFTENSNFKENREIFIAPPFVYLDYVKKKIEKFSLEFKVGAQNCYFEDKGAYTGEISVKMLLDLNLDFVIVGHSERRNIFNEDDEMLNNKVKKVLYSDLICIFCVGEKLNEREKGKTFEVLKHQLSSGLKDIINSEKLIIAYEPVWAIGTGKNATVNQIEEAHTFIKEFLNKNVAKNLPVLYGGSVKPENITEILSVNNVDGVLVGGASLLAEKFYKIING